MHYGCISAWQNQLLPNSSHYPVPLADAVHKAQCARHYSVIGKYDSLITRNDHQTVDRAAIPLMVV